MAAKKYYVPSQPRVDYRIDGYPNRCEADWLSLEARILAHQERVAREEPEGEREFREGMADTRKEYDADNNGETLAGLVPYLLQ